MTMTPGRTPRARAQRPYALWLAVSFFFMYSFFQRVCLGTQVKELMRDFGISAAATGALAGSYFYLYMALQLPFGLAFDYVGSMDGIMGVSAALLAGGAVVFAEAPTVGAAFAGRLLVGASAGVGWIACLRVANKGFPDHVAAVSGVSVALGVSGGLIGNGPWAYVVEDGWWRRGMAVSASLPAVLACFHLARWTAKRRRRAGGGASPATAARAAVVHHRPAAGPADDDDDDSPAAGAPPSLRASLSAVIRCKANWILAWHGFFLLGPSLAFGALWMPVEILRNA